MKTKLLALIIAILCFVTVFAACEKKCKAHVDENKDAVCDNCGETVEVESESDTETEGVCDHIDADADKKCDNCGKAIVSIIEQIPAETETIVDMIVNSVPENAELATFLNTTLAEHEKITKAEKVASYEDRVGTILLVESEDEEGVKTHMLIDAVANEILLTVTDTVTSTDVVRYDITLDEAWYVVHKEEGYLTVDDFGITSFNYVRGTYTVYTYSGEQIGDELVDDSLNFVTFVPPVLSFNTSGNAREYYVTFEGNTYAISLDDHKIIYSCMEDVIVPRPIMDCVVGDYGYIVEKDANSGYDVGINVYNLKEWIDCKYAYELPSNAVCSYINVLDNGNILVSYSKPLPAKTVNYDYIQHEQKYDMVYTLIDVKTFEEKNVEFGYFIENVFMIDDIDVFSSAAEGYNLVYARDVVEGHVDYETIRILLVDNDLKVICDLSECDGMQLVGDGVFCRDVGFNDGIFVKELIDANGEHIDYVPYESTFAFGYRILGNRIYDLDNTVVLDLSGYNFVNGLDFFREAGYLILSKEVEVRETVVDPNTGLEDVLVSTETVHSIFSAKNGLQTIDTSAKEWLCYHMGYNGYMVTYKEDVTVEEDSFDAEGNPIKVPVTRTVVFYEFYNTEGEFIFKSDSLIHGVVETVFGHDGSRAYILSTNNDELYIAK